MIRIKLPCVCLIFYYPLFQLICACCPKIHIPSCDGHLHLLYTITKCVLARPGNARLSVIKLVLFSVLHNYIRLLYWPCVCNLDVTFFRASGGASCVSMWGWFSFIGSSALLLLSHTQRTELSCSLESLYKELNLTKFTLFPELSQLARHIRVRGL